MIYKIVCSVFFVILSFCGAKAQQNDMYLILNTGFHSNYSALSSIKIGNQGVGKFYGGDGKSSAIDLHYNIGLGHRIIKNLYAEIFLGKYNLKHVHDFGRIVGVNDVAPKIKLKQSFYQAGLTLNYKNQITEKFSFDIFLGTRLLRGKSRVVPDFAGQANDMFKEYTGYESAIFDSAKVGVSVNNTNLFGLNALGGFNIQYKLNDLFSVYLGPYFETGFKSMITTGSLLKEYHHDNGVVDAKTSTQVSISDGSGIGVNVGLILNLK